MSRRHSFLIIEAAQEVGIEEKIILDWIEREWIRPLSVETSAQRLDEEDLARARLIQGLREAFQINDEAMPIILHLIDQLHGLHLQIEKNLEKMNSQD